jgi:hypothetical protein
VPESVNNEKGQKNQNKKAEKGGELSQRRRAKDFKRCINNERNCESFLAVMQRWKEFVFFMLSYKVGRRRATTRPSESQT